MQQLPQILSGTVSRFQGDGRRLGYPTANIKTTTKMIDGVYFGYVDLAGFTRHPAIIFIGTPTTMGASERRLEAHLLDIPDEDYYDQMLTVTIYHFHRSNKTFASMRELQKAIQADETAARQWFAQYNQDTH